MKEKEKEIVAAVYKDLRKHEVEILSGEISPVIAEIEFMIKVKKIVITVVIFVY